MQLLAIAGGAGPGVEDLLSFCGTCPVLPLVVVLLVLALRHSSVMAAFGALLLVGLPQMFLWQIVNCYQPSDDGDIMADQAVGRSALRFYSWMAGIAAIVVVAVIVRQFLMNMAPTKTPSDQPPTKPPPS